MICAQNLQQFCHRNSGRISPVFHRLRPHGKQWPMARSRNKLNSQSVVGFSLFYKTTYNRTCDASLMKKGFGLTVESTLPSDFTLHKEWLVGAATRIIFAATNLLRQKMCFVATKVCLPRQNFCCHDKTFAMTKMILEAAHANDKRTPFTDASTAQPQISAVADCTIASSSSPSSHTQMENRPSPAGCGVTHCGKDMRKGGLALKALASDMHPPKLARSRWSC